MKTWTKPFIGGLALTVAGAYTLTHDGAAQAANPLEPRKQHDTFVIMGSTATTSATLVSMQNMVTGDLYEVPQPEWPRRGRLRYFKVV